MSYAGESIEMFCVLMIIAKVAAADNQRDIREKGEHEHCWKVNDPFSQTVIVYNPQQALCEP